MAYRKYICTLISLYLFSTFHVISADEVCDKSKCKGPLKYYESVGCIPTYSGDTCCPAKYNCDHLKGRATDKCYYKSHVYNLHETLRAEDANPCDIGCTCQQGFDVAQFRCAQVTCPLRAEPNCYLKKSHDKCCSGPQICPQNEPDIARCEVDGKTYFDGQQFTPSSDPTLSCICGEGYTGENTAPFCRPVRPYTCSTELRRASDIYNNCAPAFYSSQNPATDCNMYSKCQNEGDTVLVAGGATVAEGTPLSDPTPVCTLGQLIMKIGEQVGPKMDNYVCLKCVCDTPPLPTCQEVTAAECETTQS